MYAKNMNKPLLMVGIPSFNEYDTIGGVLQRIDEGLAKYYPDYPALIVNIDNSPDTRTKHAFLNTKTVTAKRYINTHAPRGYKGTNVYRFFSYAVKHNAAAAAICDGDLKSNDPKWMRILFDPILKDGYDHLFPLYERHQYDGSITNFICYPIVRGVLGHDIRQPIGGEMSFSLRALHMFMSVPWSRSSRRFGVDIFMTLQSIIGGMKMGQVSLGVKQHKPSGPKLNSMVIDVTQTLFHVLRGHPTSWQRQLKLHSYPPLNKFSGPNSSLSISLDIDTLNKWAQRGFKEQQETIGRILKNNSKLFFSNGIRYIDEEEWAEILLLFLFAPSSYSPRVLAKALRPLYFARFLNYHHSTQHKSHNNALSFVEKQACTVWGRRGEILEK